MNDSFFKKQPLEMTEDVILDRIETLSTKRDIEVSIGGDIKYIHNLQQEVDQLYGQYYALTKDQ